MNEKYTLFRMSYAKPKSVSPRNESMNCPIHNFLWRMT